MDRKALWRLVQSGRWIRELPGTFRHAVVPPTWEQAVMLACLWGGPHAVASHRCAGRLWHLDACEDAAVEITVPYGKLERVDGPRVHRTRRLDPRDRRVRRGLPVTSVERTVVDLAAVCDPERLEIATESAVRMGLTTQERLFRSVDDHWGKLGLRPLRYILRLQQEKPSKSRWEVKLRRLIREAGLPEPVREFSVWDGETMREIDLSYPEALFGIEYDSHRWHSSRQQWERTHTRFANLISRGWTILPVTMGDVELEPEDTVGKIRRILVRAGLV